MAANFGADRQLRLVGSDQWGYADLGCDDVAPDVYSNLSDILWPGNQAENLIRLNVSWDF